MNPFELKPCPKPPKRVKTRTRMKACNRKRKGSSFPRQRDAKYRRWIRTENDCLLWRKPITARVGLYDKYPVYAPAVLEHRCWGPIDPAHVGDSQARGAPDFGVIVPLCRAAHDFYDQHRSRWAKVTGYTEATMASEASGYGLRYVERGGVPASSGVV